jgi:primosomal protein N'
VTTTPKVQDVPVSVPGGAFAEVALPVPLRQEFTYRVPEAFRARLRPGSVVRVPFAPAP